MAWTPCRDCRARLQSGASGDWPWLGVGSRLVDGKETSSYRVSTVIRELCLCLGVVMAGGSLTQAISTYRCHLDCFHLLQCGDGQEFMPRGCSRPKLQTPAMAPNRLLLRGTAAARCPCRSFARRAEMPAGICVCLQCRTWRDGDSISAFRVPYPPRPPRRSGFHGPDALPVR